jgi:hypothetical protein
MSHRLILIHNNNFLEHINYLLKILLADVQLAILEEPNVFVCDLIVEFIKGKVLIAFIDGILILNVVYWKLKNWLVIINLF